MNKSFLRSCISIGLILALTSCVAPLVQSDPLSNWKLCGSQDPQNVDVKIRKDYEDFLSKLPPKEKQYTGDIALFEDGNGQHAVSIEVFARNQSASWRYDIFYDVQNKRIKQIKCCYRRYMS